jgi:hypothetical protein
MMGMGASAMECYGRDCWPSVQAGVRQGCAEQIHRHRMPFMVGALPLSELEFQRECHRRRNEGTESYREKSYGRRQVGQDVEDEYKMIV